MKKVVVIVLVVVAVLAVGVLAVRPGGGSESVTPPAYVELIDSVTPKSDVGAVDMSGQQCWDDSGVLTVPSGSTCSSRLPDRANRLRLCVSQGAPARVLVRGSDFAPQDVDLRTLGCGGDEAVRLYDKGASLDVTCLPTSPPCRLNLR